MRYLILIFSVFSILGISGQTMIREKWNNEYKERRIKTVDRFKKEKPEFSTQLQVTKPDYVVFVPKVETEVIGDTYNDHFLVFDKPGSETLFAIWTQATLEGDLDHHIVFSKSLDKGKTWSEPVILAGCPNVSSTKPIASWGFPLISKSGRIYIIYNQYVAGKYNCTRQHTGLMMGIYSDNDGKTWTKPQEVKMPRSIYDNKDRSIPSEWVVWQKPARLVKNNKYIVGLNRYKAPDSPGNFITGTEFIRFDNIDKNPKVKNIAISFLMKDENILTYNEKCEESSIVKLPDNRLFALMRTMSGYPVWSVSNDEGETWTKPLPLKDKNGKVYPQPLSPCPMYDWKGNEAASGLYFAMIHNAPPFPDNVWRPRGPIFLLPGKFSPNDEQPIQFGEPKLFSDKPDFQSFYTSTTIVDEKLVLWYPDLKFFLLGRKIDSSWFE